MMTIAKVAGSHAGRMTRGLILVALVIVAMGASACSSGELEDSVGGEGEQQQALDSLRSVLVRRAPAPAHLRHIELKALDSQNALPTSAFSDPTIRGLLQRVDNDEATSGRISDANTVLQRLVRLELGPVLIQYLARCALREDERLFGQPGRLGLGEGWPSESAQRWVTACLMAHTNNLASLPIALSGKTDIILASDAEPRPAMFAAEEAAFFGNVFSNNPALYACAGARTQALCADRGTSYDLERRLCGKTSTRCGFKFVGPCNDLTGASEGACTEALPYLSCQGGTERFSEVITVSLSTDAGLRSLHPTCKNGSSEGTACRLACSIGSAMSRECSTATTVCATDAYCCTQYWDSVCARQAGCRL